MMYTIMQESFFSNQFLQYKTILFLYKTFKNEIIYLKFNEKKKIWMLDRELTTIWQVTLHGSKLVVKSLRQYTKWFLAEDNISNICKVSLPLETQFCFWAIKLLWRPLHTHTAGWMIPWYSPWHNTKSWDSSLLHCENCVDLCFGGLYKTLHEACPHSPQNCVDKHHYLLASFSQTNRTLHARDSSLTWSMSPLSWKTK